MTTKGRLHLDELITRNERLDEIDQGYVDVHAGVNMRGVIVHEHRWLCGEADGNVLR